MSIIVNDPANLPIKIYQLPLSRFKCFTPDFFGDIIKKNLKYGMGIEKNNYYLIQTTATVSSGQFTKELVAYQLLLKAFSKRGFIYLMIIKNK